MKLNNESKTLFIPLLGKAIMSKEKLFLNDPKAEEIISKIDYEFSSLKQSKWLSMYMALRAHLIDELCNKYIENHPNATILHLGCGLDSRCLRVNQNFNAWYDIDYKNVIEKRKKYFEEDSKHKMIGSSVLDPKWIEQVKNNQNILVIAEGLTMYLTEKEIKELITNINKKFKYVHLIFDAYSKKGIKISKIKNPVNQMNAKVKYGIDKPEDFLKLNKNIEYVETHLIKKENNKLHGITKIIFNNIYCGKMAHSFYKIYEFNLKRQ